MKNVFLFVGIALVLIGIALIFLSLIKEGKTKASGIILIGPFPIVFGSDQESLFLSAVVGIVLLLIVFFILFMFGKL